MHENLRLVRELQHRHTVAGVQGDAPAQKAASGRTQRLRGSVSMNEGSAWRGVSPVGTTVDVSTCRDVLSRLVTDEDVEVLDGVHLTGVLQDQDIRPRTGHAQIQLEV